ncbi:uncharacterized protein [Danio rerio]|uniref:Uncharacterized protein n=1 Tax=Danio rerio TaxID=7955 RepID=A0AC58JWS0_DANRE
MQCEDVKMKRSKEVRENEMNEEQKGYCGKEECSELPEEYYHGLEHLPWNLNSLEQLLYVSLPAWIQRALLCNLAEQFSVWTFHNNFLPCRLISYALLPYTLSATALISFIYRFLCWLKTFLQQALITGRELKQEVMVNLTFSQHSDLPEFYRLLLLPLVPALAPWFCLPALSLTSLPHFPSLSSAFRFLSCRLATSSSKMRLKHRSQKQPVCLSFQLSESGTFCKNTDNITTKTRYSTFHMQLDVKLEIDKKNNNKKTETPQLQRNMYDHEGRLLQDWRNEDEDLSYPFISCMDAQEEE